MKINPFENDLVAENYRYRIPYHPEFIERLIADLGVKKTDIALDLLCGRGEIASHLSRYCDQVVAVDGSRAMLSQAFCNDKIHYLCGDVNLPDFLDIFGGRRFLYCFIGRAIHWVEQGSLIRLRENLFFPDGFLITMQGGFSGDNSWIRSYRRIVSDYAGPSGETDWRSEQKVIDSGFRKVKSINISFKMRVDIKFLMGHSLSYSTRAQALKLQLGEFEAALREELKFHSSDGEILLANVSNCATLYQMI